MAPMLRSAARAWRCLASRRLEELLGLELPPRSRARCDSCGGACCCSSATPPTGATNSEALRRPCVWRPLPRPAALRDGAVLARTGHAGSIVQTLRARLDIGLGRRDRRLPGDSDAWRRRAPGCTGRLKGRDASCWAGLLRGCRRRMRKPRVSRRPSRARKASRPSCRCCARGFRCRHQAEAGRCPRASCCSTTGSWSCWARSTAPRSSKRRKPALLAVLAADLKADVRVQIVAARCGAASQCSAAGRCGGRLSSPGAAGTATADPSAQSADPLLRRALYFQAAEGRDRPAQRLRFLRAIIDDARRSGSLLQTARVVAPLMADLQPSPDVAANAETVSRSRFSRDSSTRPADGPKAPDPPWLALIDVADPERRGRPPALGAMEELAVRGRSAPRRCIVLPPCSMRSTSTCRSGCGRRRAARRQPRDRYLPEPACWPSWRRPPSATDAAAPSCSSCARWGPPRPEGRQCAGDGERGARVEAASGSRRCPPAGAGGADRGLARTAGN